MKRFLIPAAAAFVLFAPVQAANAQEVEVEVEVVETTPVDPGVEIVEAPPAVASDAAAFAAEVANLRREIQDLTYRAPMQRVLRAHGQCRTPDPADVQLALAQANAVSRQAGELAYRLPGHWHVAALEVQRQAETDFWRVSTARPAERCYVPPA